MPEIDLAHGGGEPRLMRSRPLSYAEMAVYDVVVIVTDHRYFDPDQILRHARRIVDTRNLTAGPGRSNHKVVKL